MHLYTATPLTFVIPDVNAFQSGGNIYNKNLIAGLQKNGYFPEIVDLVNFEKKDIDQLEGHYFFDTLYFTQLESIFAKKNKVTQFWLIVHHLESLYPPKDWSANDYFQQKEYPFLVQFDGFLTSSQFTADYLIRHGLSQKKIVIPPAVDYLPNLSSTRKPSPIMALMVANLVERKGILPFLKRLATSHLVISSEVLNIQLIGSKEIEKGYAGQCLTLLDNNPALKKSVTYVGELSSERIPTYYRQANLFISTAFMETYGMALQEARSFRLPILALKGGNIESHVQHGSSGYLVNSLDQLVSQLEQLLLQPELLAKLQANIEHTEAIIFYDWQAAGKQLLDLMLNDNV